MTPADPTLNALLVATATEDWPAWYGCTRLALADYLEDRDLVADGQTALAVRGALPVARVEASVREGYELLEVRLGRSGEPRAAGGNTRRVVIDGHRFGDDGWSRLADHCLRAGTSVTIDGASLRPFPVRALRFSAVIADRSEVSVGVWFNRPGGGGTARWGDIVLDGKLARLGCRRDVLALFPEALVTARCYACLGTGFPYHPTGRKDLRCLRCGGAGSLTLPPSDVLRACTGLHDVSAGEPAALAVTLPFP